MNENNKKLREWLIESRNQDYIERELSADWLKLEDFNIGYPIEDDLQDTQKINVNITLSNAAIDNPTFGIVAFIGEKINKAMWILVKKYKTERIALSSKATIGSLVNKESDWTSISLLLNVCCDGED